MQVFSAEKKIKKLKKIVDNRVPPCYNINVVER